MFRVPLTLRCCAAIRLQDGAGEAGQHEVLGRDVSTPCAVLQGWLAGLALGAREVLLETLRSEVEEAVTLKSLPRSSGVEVGSKWTPPRREEGDPAAASLAFEPRQGAQRFRAQSPARR